MKIWVDADACPKPIKQILLRAAGRVSVPVTLVSNKPMRLRVAEHVQSVLVGAGPDVADEEICRRVVSGDLVVTDDVPLAGEVIAKGAFVINFRGDLLTEEGIGERLSLRNFMTGLRDGGVEVGGPSRFRNRDSQAFADQLDRFLTRNALRAIQKTGSGI